MLSGETVFLERPPLFIGVHVTLTLQGTFSETFISWAIIFIKILFDFSYLCGDPFFITAGSRIHIKDCGEIESSGG